MRTLLTLAVSGSALSLLLSCSSAPPQAPSSIAPPTHALTELELACLRDPGVAASWRRLSLALDADGQTARAALALRQAQILEQHDVRADLRLMQSELQTTRLLVREDGLLELVREPMQRELSALLEIRNGNGVRGMARSYAASLNEDGLRVVRLSNARGFSVGATSIEYYGDFAGTAQLLADRLGAARAVPASASLGPANVRVLLGHDQKKKKPPRRAAMEENAA
jgi:hypothetical protein